MFSISFTSWAAVGLFWNSLCKHHRGVIDVALSWQNVDQLSAFVASVSSSVQGRDWTVSGVWGVNPVSSTYNPGSLGQVPSPPGANGKNPAYRTSCFTDLTTRGVAGAWPVAGR